MNLTESRAASCRPANGLTERTRATQASELAQQGEPANVQTATGALSQRDSFLMVGSDISIEKLEGIIGPSPDSSTMTGVLACHSAAIRGAGFARSCPAVVP